MRKLNWEQRGGLSQTHAMEAGPTTAEKVASFLLTQGSEVGWAGMHSHPHLPCVANVGAVKGLLLYLPSAAMAPTG